MGVTRRTFVGAGLAFGAGAALRADHARSATDLTDPVGAFETAVRRFAEARSSPAYDQSFAVQATPSVVAGDALELRLRSSQPTALALLRVVWSPRAGRPSGEVVASATVSTAADLSTAWAPTVRGEWPSGLYMVVATQASGAVRFAPVVVRSPVTERAAVMVQVPLTTYHAYNGWGGASLYRYNSPDGSATELALTRPFDVFDGAGFAFYGDVQLAAWLHREGIAASWTTSLDLHARADALDGARVLVTSFHDEYWSTPMRDRLELFVAGGGNAVWLAANSVYWRVRIDGDRMVCRKAVTALDDPHPEPTCTWRNPLAGKSEHLLMGSRYLDYEHPYGTGFPYVVANARHWAYDGTGLADGDVIEGLVGYEWDHAPHADMAGLTLLADGTFRSSDGDEQRHHATVLEHPGGGTVVNVGTTYWPRFLLGDAQFPADERIGSVTHNLLARLAR